MTDGLSLSIFAVEVDRIPIFAIQGKRQLEAEKVLADEGVREQLRRLTSCGKPLCDDFSIFRMRIARPDERAQFFKSSDSLLTSGSNLTLGARA